MARDKNPNRLKKFLLYILGYRPDEFGLALDRDGFVRIKDLLQAVNEESGWGYVRRSHIDEVVFRDAGNDLIVREERIGLSSKNDLSFMQEGVVPPKVLYFCVRRRAYPTVLERGIYPRGNQSYVVLSKTEGLALRIGKRRDQKPVLLIIHARAAYDSGISFGLQGELIYTTDHIPPEYFTGPQLPKEVRGETVKKEPPSRDEFMPGSFLLDLDKNATLKKQELKRKGVRKDIAWKREARRRRRKKG
nr:hypothetical protein [Desulfobacterales bacterium]